ncbi:MAG: hypothetical protein LBL86_03670 [Coriobacteriales bacterium]|nr:hypothetical protein [Coriobacteriales bacterium]
MKEHGRIALDDRRIVEESPGKGLSFARAAQPVGKGPSVAAHEVRADRMPVKTRAANAPCREQGHCEKTPICRERPTPGAVCARRDRMPCKEACACHLATAGCAKTASAPWACNGRRKLKCGCDRPGRHRHVAAVADKASRGGRTGAGRGANRTAEESDRALGVIRPALSRRPSPCETAALYAEQPKVSPSAPCRRAGRGYGGMADIEPKRKVGPRPRRQHKDRRIARHGRSGGHAALPGPAQGGQGGCVETDAATGKKADTGRLPAPCARPARLRLHVPLEEKATAEAARALDLTGRTSRRLPSVLFPVPLTDSGPEPEGPAALERSVCEGAPKRCRAFYCGPRQSRQKGRCEKSHAGLRRLLPKGRAGMDNLAAADVADANCKADSTPGRSPCGLSPTEMPCRACGERATGPLDIFSMVWPDADGMGHLPIGATGSGTGDMPFQGIRQEAEAHGRGAGIQPDSA